MIRVEQIKAPILLACGGEDLTWNSCAYSHASVIRLAAHTGVARHYLYAYRHVGHNVGGAYPYEPGMTQRDVWVPQDEQAREQLWPNIHSFLNSLH